MKRFFGVVLCVCLCVLWITVPTLHRGPTFAAEKGLAGWWKFDESRGTNVKDSSGFGNNGKLSGAKRVRGRVGMALSFEDTGSYVKIPCSPGLNLGEALSIEANNMELSFYLL